MNTHQESLKTIQGDILRAKRKEFVAAGSIIFFSLAIAIALAVHPFTFATGRGLSSVAFGFAAFFLGVAIWHVPTMWRARG